MADVYDDLKRHFAVDGRVEVAAGRGAQGIKLGKKMIVMFYKGELLLKLPPERVEELIESGHGKPYDPGTGSAIKDRVVIPAAQRESWIPLSEEALDSAGR